MKNFKLMGLFVALIVGFGSVMMATGCGNGGEAVTSLPEPVVTFPAGAVLLLVNLPTDPELAEYKVSQTLNLQNTEESMIVVSLADGTTIEVVEIEMQEDGNLVELGTIFSVNDAEAGYGFEMIALRPEGAPYYKLRITMADNTVTEYYISYNGKDGNPKLEYVFAN